MEKCTFFPILYDIQVMNFISVVGNSQKCHFETKKQIVEKVCNRVLFSFSALPHVSRIVTSSVVTLFMMNF